MKKLFLIIAVALSTILIACANEQMINVEQLPAKAQSLIQTHFSAESVSYVLQERDGLSMEYEVRFDSGSKVEFDSKGEIKKIDCDIRPVPTALIPAAVRDYVQTKFPNAIITEWGKDERRWKAELNNGIELKFNSKYEFVGIDD